MELLEIDGARGGGGGQIVRSALALSCITGRPVRIGGIRAGRPVPGLMPQHLTAARIMQQVTGARTEGCRRGSASLGFWPGRVRGMRVSADVGTAGSIPLVMQALMPLAVALDGPLRAEVRGGTDVAWSPSMDYVRYVLVPALEGMGIRSSVRVLRRGYYPRGGGRAELELWPATPVRASFPAGGPGAARIRCTFSGIGSGIIGDEVSRVEALLDAEGIRAESEVVEEEADGRGASLLVCGEGGTAAGIDSLFDARTGRFDLGPGPLRERLAADDHLADMLVVPASTAPRTSFCARAITPHLETNLFVASRVTGCRYGIGRAGGGYEVIIEGASDPGIKQGS